MQLSQWALISIAQCAEYMHMDVDDDISELAGPINYASRAIEEHVGRPLLFAAGRVRLFDSFNDGTIFFPFGPAAITSVRYDTSRAFPVETETTFLYDAPSRTLFVDQQPRGQRVYRILSDDGYTRVDWKGPAAPAVPFVGQTWLLDGQLSRYDGTDWIPMTALAVPVPDDLEATTAEYVAFIRMRMRAGGAGLQKLERGYSFEGSAVTYETDMPSHVKSRLEPYVVTGI